MKKQIVTEVPWTWQRYEHKKYKTLVFFVHPKYTQIVYCYKNSMHGYLLEKVNPIVTKVYLKIFTKGLDK